MYTVGIYNDHAEGIFFADDLQLEEGEAPSRTNLVTNGNINTAGRGWTLMSGASYTSSGEIQIIGNPIDASTKFYQDIPINKLGSTQTYVLSGWAKGNAVPDNVTVLDPATDAQAHAKDDTKQFGLRSVIYYADGTNDFFLLSFNPDLEDWQFASLAIVPTQPNKMISKIRLTVTYGKNANKAFFDNISLVQEVVHGAEYDTDGNLKYVTTPNLTSDTSTYSNGNLMKTVTAGDGTYTYKYGDSAYPHRPTQITKSTLVNGLSYDTYGNHHYNSYWSTNGGIALQTWSSYTNSGNLLSQYMDINRVSTYYTYTSPLNILYGVPNEIKDQKSNVTKQTVDA